MFSSMLSQLANAEGSSIQQYILLGGILLVFYFFMIRPQRRRQKDQRTFLENLKKGTPIVTIGGIHGKVHEVADDTVVLEIDSKGTKITISRSAISIDSTQRHTRKK